MKKLILIIAFILGFLSFSAFAQAPVPIKFGPTLPSTCAPSAKRAVLFYKTGASNGLYQCLATDTWTKVESAGSGAPTGAAYITQTADATLSAEQALASLASGILKSTTATGVISIAVAGDFPTLNQNTTGNAATATAMAANPTDCAANNFATTIAANGDLTCAQPSISAGVSGLGANVATFLGTPSSANFAAAVTGETGTGAPVFDQSPNITTPTITGAVGFQDGTRQTFNPDATNAGVNVGSHAGDPSTPLNGDLWYDSTANELTARINGANVALGAGGGATNLDGLTDVVITSAASGEFLRHNGTNWVDATIQAGDIPTGVDATKLADGTVTNSELQFINTVTSNVQTQIDEKEGAINSAITYYVCPSTHTNCAYNGDGGQSATPSDANTGLTKALPLATISAAEAKITKKTLQAVATIQLADTTGTGTSCYLPSDVRFRNLGAPGEGDLLTSQYPNPPLTQNYPQGYVWIRGNDTTSDSVDIVGATTCAGTASSVRNGFLFAGTPARISGVQLKYFKTGVTAVRSHLYLDKVNGVSDNPAPGVVDSAMAYGSQGAVIYIGGAETVTDWNGYGAHSGSWINTATPTALINLTYSNAGGERAFFANEKSHILWGGGTYSFTGAGTYRIFATLSQSSMNSSAEGSGASISFTANAANATMLEAQFGSSMFDSCGSFQFTCTFTALGKRANASDNSKINYGGTTAGTNADTASDDSLIVKNFGAGHMVLSPITGEAAQLVQRGRVAGDSTFHTYVTAFERSRNTLASPAAVQNGDILGQFNFTGHNGTIYAGAASLRAEATETYSGSTGAAKIVFATQQSGGVDSPTDRVEISPTGITSLYHGANVASAATITATGNSFHVTGTTTITSVSGTGIRAGTVITIIFDGALTFTDGSNLVLAGNFVTTANDTITLRYDGTNWYEMSRAVN